MPIHGYRKPLAFPTAATQRPHPPKTQPVEDARKEYIIFIEGILRKYGTTGPGIPFEETMMIEIYGDKALFFTKRGDRWVFTIIKQRTIPHPIENATVYLIHLGQCPRALSA